MPPLPKSVRVGRHGRIGILKKVPRDLWEHPRYADKAKIIERSTGTADEVEGVRAAQAMLAALELEFAQARAELREADDRIVETAGLQNPASDAQPVLAETADEPLESGSAEMPARTRSRMGRKPGATSLLQRQESSPKKDYAGRGLTRSPRKRVLPSR